MPMRSRILDENPPLSPWTGEKLSRKLDAILALMNIINGSENRVVLNFRQLQISSISLFILQGQCTGSGCHFKSSTGQIPQWSRVLDGSARKSLNLHSERHGMWICFLAFRRFCWRAFADSI